MTDLEQAIYVRAHCRVMAVGMHHSRISKTRMLEIAGNITGKSYKRGQHAQAAEDLTAYIEGEKNGRREA